MPPGDVICGSPRPRVTLIRRVHPHGLDELSSGKGSMRLKGKVALVTGASSGIGAAVAARFAAEGALVAVNYRPGSPRDREAAEAAVAGFESRAIAVEADVSNREMVEAAVARVVAELGRIDIAVNNAGIEIKRGFLDTTDEEWNRVLGVNLYGSFAVSQAAAREMVKQGGG